MGHAYSTTTDGVKVIGSMVSSIDLNPEFELADTPQNNYYSQSGQESREE